MIKVPGSFVMPNIKKGDAISKPETSPHMGNKRMLIKLKGPWWIELSVKASRKQVKR